MFGSSRTHLGHAAVLGLALWPLLGAGTCQAADPVFKRVPIPTFDSVKLEGTFYPNPGGKKDAVVLLLHNFDPRKGGDSHSDGWDHLAAKLQEEGYVVLSFDFRGFGNSKTLEDPAKFWMFRHNRENLKGAEAAKLPDTIDQKKFPPQYYTNLINDIAAAKAFLDRQSDAGECNSANLVVIGAGEGAALGAMYLAALSHLQRDRAPMFAVQPLLDEPEIKDVAAAVWLSLSPTVAGRSLPLKHALKEVGRDDKVPVAFIYGTKDPKGPNIAKACLDEIRSGRKDELKLTGEKKIDTDLVGSKLLQDTLDTEQWIIKSYINEVIDKRGARERKKRDLDKYRYFWAFPKPGPTARLVPAKPAGVDTIGAIPLDMLTGN